MLAEMLAALTKLNLFIRDQQRSYYDNQSQLLLLIVECLLCEV